MRIDNINKLVKDGYAWLSLTKRKRKRIMRRVVKGAIKGAAKDNPPPNDLHTDAPHLYADYLAGRITHTYELYKTSGLGETVVEKILSLPFDKFMYSIILQQKSEMNAAKDKTSSILEKDPSNN